MWRPESDNPRVHSDELYRLSWTDYAKISAHGEEQMRRYARRLVRRAICGIALLLAAAVGLIWLGLLVMGK